jgi:hypothetical protein
MLRYNFFVQNISQDIVNDALNNLLSMCFCSAPFFSVGNLITTSSLGGFIAIGKELEELQVLSVYFYSFCLKPVLQFSSRQNFHEM